MPTEMRSRFVLADGVRTHYTESGGDGPVIIALHGAGTSSFATTASATSS